MCEQTLEFRGIPVHTLYAYLCELGGTAECSELPAMVQGDDWQAVIMREEMVSITSRFQVNAVFIRFFCQIGGTADSPAESISHEVHARGRLTGRAEKRWKDLHLFSFVQVKRHPAVASV